MNIINLYKTIKVFFIKDLLLDMSYKISFFSQFFLIFVQILLFYYLSILINIDASIEAGIIENNNYFKYVIVGICFIDILGSITNALPNEVMNNKSSGVLEEILVSNKNFLFILFGISAYPVFISFVKLLLYFMLAYLFFDITIFKIQNIFFAFINILLFFISLVLVGLVACSYTIRFYKTKLIPTLFLLLNVFAGEAYFPMEMLPEVFQQLSLLTSFSYAIENMRMLDNLDFSSMIFFKNIYHMCMLILMYALIAAIFLKYSLNYAKKNGTFLHY